MQTISRKIKYFVVIIDIFITTLANASDLDLSLSLHDIQISMKKPHQVVAKEIGGNLTYQISKAVSNHLKKAYDVRMISDKSDQNGPLFIVLSREPSKPNSMGRGYCGAGYEEYLLLIEISRGKLELRDQFLLQSCLKSISLRIEHGDDLDDAGNGLTSNDDGSLSYRLLEDDTSQERNLAIHARRFKFSLEPARIRSSPN